MMYIVDIYAKALMESGISAKALADCCTVLQTCPVLWETLCNPTVTKKEKQNVIKRIFTGEIISFLEVLCDNGKMALLFAIQKAYHDLLQQKEGIGTATVYYTMLPEQSQKDAIAQMLCKLEHKKEFVLHWQEDKTLLGGICIQCGNKQYDRSIRNSLNLLRKNLVQGVKA